MKRPPLEIMTLILLVGIAGCSSPAWRAEPAAPGLALEQIPLTGQNAPLLYISNVYGANVSIYDYGDGSAPKLIGSLTGIQFPEGECTDSAGDVYITSESDSKIYEFEHGKTKPKTVLTDRYGYPAACAIDVRTGDLAVANEGGFNSSPGNVLIYAHAAGKPREYFAPNLENTNFCGYDDEGNLFVDGSNSASGFEFGLAKLARGAKSMKAVTVKSARIYYPSAVQWSKPYLLVGDSGYKFTDSSAIYELRVKGLSATVEGVVRLKGSGSIRQFLKQGDRVVTADLRNHRSIYAFPSGIPDGKISKGLSSAWGVAISPR